MSVFLSFIIPIYNVEKYLIRCIESIISQTFNDWELILINDGSTDNSKNIAESYAKKYPNIHFINSNNYGVSHARNLGLMHATGKYISFIDSDDEIEKNALTIFKDLEFNNHTSLYKFGYSKIINGTKSNIISQQVGSFNVPQTLLIIEQNMYSGFLWNSIFRKDIIDKYKLKFDESISWCEDHLFFYEYLSHCVNIYISNSIYYKYYVGTNSFSLSQKERSPLLYIDIGKREFLLKEKCNPNKISELIILNKKGFNEKCIIAIRQAIAQNWNLKNLLTLYQNVKNTFSFTKDVYIFKNKTIFTLYCLAKKIYHKY